MRQRPAPWSRLAAPLLALVVGASPAFARAPIAFLHTAPESAEQGRSLVISGNVFGAAELDRAVLVYRVGSGSWKRVEFDREGADTYFATIPGSDLTADVSYYVEATDFFGDTLKIFRSPEAPQRVAVRGAPGAVATAPKDPPARGEPPRTEPPRTATPAASPAEASRPAELALEPAPREPPPREPAERESPRTPATRVEPPVARVEPPVVETPAEPPPAGSLSEALAKSERDSAPTRRAVRIEHWEPDEPEGASAAPHDSAPDATPPDRSALAEDLMMFAADDTTSLASRHQQTVSEAPAIVSVVTAEQIRALDLRTLADLMKTLPGFETSRDVQGFWRIAARGRRSDPELLVLYDGHRLNNPYDGRVDWELPLENVERVEVIRGPGSALYGAGAFAAVVNLVPKGDLGAAASVTAGSFGTWEARARGGRKFGAISVFGELDAATRSGYVKPIQRDSISTNPDTPAGTTDDRRHGFGGAVRAEYPLGEGRPTVTASLRSHVEDRAALVGLVDVVGKGSNLGATQLLGDVGVTAAFDGWTLKSRAYLDNQTTDRLFVLLPDGFRIGSRPFEFGVRQQTRISMWSYGVEASGSSELFAGNTATVGLQLERQSIGSYSFLANVEGEKAIDGGALLPPSDVSFPQDDPERNARSVVGLFVQDEWRLAEQLQLTGGLRVDYVSGFDLALNPRLALVWRPLKELVAKVMFAHAFRAPTFEESLTKIALAPTFNTGQSAGNASLRPVNVNTLEAGAESALPAGDGLARLRLNAFWNEFSDAIEPVDQTGLPKYENREKGVRVLGAEVEGRYEWPRRGGATFVNLAWFRARDLTANELTPDFALLTDVPQLRANWGLVLPLGPASLTLSATFGSERRNNARTTLEATRRFRIPAYGLFAVTLRSRPFFERFEASASVFNVSDVNYFDDVPRPDERRMPGLLPREGVHGVATVRASW